MPSREKRWSALIEACRVSDGRGFRLSRHDPGETNGLAELKEDAEELLRRGIAFLAEQQDKLYAQDRWGVLLIFQAMDAAGKDSAIKHVMSGVNPQGVEVTPFKAPSAEELDHDFLWRCWRKLPERGRIGIFNRSYYEEVLVVRVHPEFLEAQRLPPALTRKTIWKDRFADIRAFESYLARNGYVIRKFFLNVSREEQRKRFLARLEKPQKNWKFSSADVRERQHWDEYMHAYEDMIRHTATPEAPWYVVPADKKWFTRLVVAATIADTLADLDLRYPKAGRTKRRELETARRKLEQET